MECTLRCLRGVLALWDIVVAAMAKIKFYTFNLKEVNYNWLDGKMEKDDLFNNWSDSTYELGRELELITHSLSCNFEHIVGKLTNISSLHSINGVNSLTSNQSQTSISWLTLKLIFEKKQSTRWLALLCRVNYANHFEKFGRVCSILELLRCHSLFIFSTPLKCYFPINVLQSDLFCLFVFFT